MFAIAITVLLLAADPKVPADSLNAGLVPSENAAVAKSRSPSELRAAVQQSLKTWAKPADGDLNKAGRELLGLYNEVLGNAQLTPTVRESLRLSIRSRLSDIANKLGTVTDKGKSKPAVEAAVPVGNNPVLGQVMGRPPAQRIGGPNPGAAGAAGRMGTTPTPLPDDNGEDLADLIQKTIHPNSWERNGGSGSIYYWRLGRAMVIQQSQEVHEQISDLLGQLQRAGN